MKRILAAIGLSLAALLPLAATSTPAEAQSGSIRLNVVKGGWFIGASGGNGVLTYRGRSYPLTVGGISLGLTFGGSAADLVGRVYNLRRVTDIEGVYSQIQGGAAVGVGASAARLQNANGVVLDLRGRQAGLELALDVSGMTINLRR